ncbi:hypothetical protein BC940DRAFT_328535 [Gongronella butleri]|nr:hypothetical protein BC940DRAFT_328535 [Gongronella butleri]
MVSTWWLLPDGSDEVYEATAAVSSTRDGAPDQTYWCAIGFDMGYMGMMRFSKGYGLQGLEVLAHENRTFVQFAHWDDPARNIHTETVQLGDGFIDSHFDNEGIGRRVVKPVTWDPTKRMYFRIQVREAGNGNRQFVGSYSDSGRADAWQLMAVFQVSNSPDHFLKNFYSFTEIVTQKQDQMREGYFEDMHLRLAGGRDITPIGIEYNHEALNVTMYKITGPNQYYLRMGGTPDQGVFKPTNPKDGTDAYF